MIPIESLIVVYDDVFIHAIERAARCTRCKGKSTISTQIIYVGGREIAMYSSYILTSNKDFWKKIPVLW